MSKEQKKATNLPTKISLGLRLVVGVYLLYTAWSLRGSFQTHTGGELLFFAAFTVLFAVAGALLTTFSAYAFYRGRYAGGAMDAKTGEGTANEEERL